jgi:hypothetical protein
VGIKAAMESMETVDQTIWLAVQGQIESTAGPGMIGFREERGAMRSKAELAGTRFVRSTAEGEISWTGAAVGMSVSLT